MAKLDPYEYMIASFLKGNAGRKFSASEIANETEIDARTIKDRMIKLRHKIKQINKIGIGEKILYFYHEKN